MPRTKDRRGKCNQRKRDRKIRIERSERLKEINGIKLEHEDTWPVFEFRQMSANEKQNCDIVESLRPIKESKAMMDLFKSFDINHGKGTINDPDRYGPVEYDPKYGIVSPEATLAAREVSQLKNGNPAL